MVDAESVIVHRNGSAMPNLIQMRERHAMAGGPWPSRTKDLDSIPIVPEYLPVPYVDAVTSATGKTYKLTPVRVTICSLRCSDQPKQARAFMEFVASDRARKLLEEYGFRVSEQVRRQEYLNGKPLTTPKVN
jgi:hypothetical protein